MKIHLLATWPHYARHVRAVWKHLPREVRGEEIIGGRARAQHLPLTDIVMVGSFIDIDLAGDHRVIYVEHGAGQTYVNLDEEAAQYYPGGHHPSKVIGYICPSQRVADLWDRPAIAVGCPALDEVKPNLDSHEVAVTFHWDARRVAPESRSARDHYFDDLSTIVQWIRTSDYEPLGHWHPRDGNGQTAWDNLGIPVASDPDTVLSRVGLVIADNTSLMYEAALLDIPVICLNAPWYRKDVEHGLRFWSHMPGQDVNSSFELVDKSLTSRLSNTDGIKRRREAAAYAYAEPPGESGAKAAAWILDLVN